MVGKTRGNRSIWTRRSITALAVIVGLLATAFAWSRRGRRSGSTVWNAETEQTIADAIETTTDLYYLPQGIVRAICMVESRCQPVNAIGSAGEIGVMQVTPPAMIDMQTFIDLDSDLFEQVDAGAKWIRYLADRWIREVGGVFDFVTDWEFVIRAYNAGFDGALSGNGQAYLDSVLEQWTDRPYLT